MRRRSFLMSLLSSVFIGPALARSSEAPAALRIDLRKQIRENIAQIRSFAPYPCPECDSYTLVPGPPNIDIYVCDCCGAVTDAYHLIRNLCFEHCSIGDQHFTIAINRDPSPYWRNHVPGA